MELKNQLCSLESAKKLKDLGVPQNSLFAWHKEPVGEAEGSTNSYWLSFSDEKKTFEVASAFTCSELGDMLGNESASKHLMKAYGHAFNVPDTRFATVRGVQLAMQNPELGAKMLIYLLENNLINLE